MSYYGGWDNTYYEAKRLFENAKMYEGRTMAQALKEALNMAYSLPNNHPEKENLIYDIEHYAYKYRIDLDDISGYY